jgi:alkylhydroperoxidase family enzyme
VSDAQLQEMANYEQSGAFTEHEKAVLRFAEQWTRKNKVDGEVMKQLSGFLGSTQLVVLAATVALANWTNRFNESFAVELP